MRNPPVSQDLFTEICEALECCTEGLEPICAEFNVAKTSFIRSINRSDANRQRYLEAKRRQALILSDEILSICDNKQDDMVSTKDGMVGNPVAVQRDRLRTDTRKWLLARLLPKDFGDKTEGTLTINNNKSQIKWGDSTIEV